MKDSKYKYLFVDANEIYRMVRTKYKDLPLYQPEYFSKLIEENSIDEKFNKVIFKIHLNTIIRGYELEEYFFKTPFEYSIIKKDNKKYINARSKMVDTNNYVELSTPYELHDYEDVIKYYNELKAEGHDCAYINALHGFMQDVRVIDFYNDSIISRKLN